MLCQEESEKVGLKLNIQKTKIIASGPISSWQIDGETVETVADFILGGSKISAVGDCSHEIKRRLLLGRKVMTNLPGVFSERCTGKLPLRVDFIHMVEFEEVSGHRVLIKRGPGNRGPTECGTPHEATTGMSS